MNTIVQHFTEQLVATSALEWIAVLLAITYLLLVIKENIWCWPAAFFSTAIYVYLFFNVNLYMESVLNFYYLIMAIYGWQQWNVGGRQSRSIPEKQIISWSLKKHFLLVTTTAMIVWISSWLLAEHTHQDFPLVDSFTTWFAVLATYMVTQKVIENWLYWVIIDMVSIYLYLSKDFALTAVLFFVYIIFAIVGWFSWKKRLRDQPYSAAANAMKTPEKIQ